MYSIRLADMLVPKTAPSYLRKVGLMSKPAIFVTATLPCPVMGGELIGAVKELSKRDGIFATSAYISDGLKIGRFSMYLFRQLVVAPSQEVHEVDLVATYIQVCVIEHQWDGDIFPIGYADRYVIDSVTDFAQRLEQFFT
jgi:hypothetical protein